VALASTRIKTNIKDRGRSCGEIKVVGRPFLAFNVEKDASAVPASALVISSDDRPPMFDEALPASRITPGEKETMFGSMWETIH
jgi:hypothetical protein